LIAVELVQRLAADVDLWQPLVQYGSGEERWYHQLDVDPRYDVWLISWLPGQGTGIHDHGEAQGAFTVVRGALTETTVHRRRSSEHVDLVRRRFTEGKRRAFGYDHIHDVANLGLEPAVSIHAYAPELTAMTKYELEGQVLRVLSSERAGVNW
jgi:predicted metal-dependent enzyme (double-stranded beta helix superfamily)